LGGLVTALAGHVPVRGEIIVEDGIEFEVTDADPRRVKRVRIRMTEARLRSEHIEDNPIADEPAGMQILRQGGSGSCPFRRKLLSSKL